MNRVARKAISPVISVILMVAITVVLATVVYIYVTKFMLQEKTPVGMFSFNKQHMPGGAIHYYGSVQFSEDVKLKLSEVKVVVINGNFSGSALLSELDPDGATGIVGEWHFEEGTGTVRAATVTYDTSGNENDGAVVGAAWTTGVCGYALSFDGVDDYVIRYPINNFPDTEITVEFWMKSLDTTKKGTPLSYATTHADNEFRIYNYNKFYICIGGYHEGQSVSTHVSANDGIWHYIAVTWKSSDGSLKLYKDDSLAYSGTLMSGYSIVNGGSLVFGQDQDSIGGSFGLDQAFLGTIDEIRIYNRTLTQGEAKVHSGGLAFYFQDVDNDGLFSSQDVFTVRGANSGARVSLVYTRTGGIIATHTF